MKDRIIRTRRYGQCFKDTAILRSRIVIIVGLTKITINLSQNVRFPALGTVQARII